MRLSTQAVENHGSPGTSKNQLWEAHKAVLSLPLGGQEKTAALTSHESMPHHGLLFSLI